MAFGVFPLPLFDEVQAHQGQFTRLGQFGVGLSKYGQFEAKEAAQPADEFVGLPAITTLAVEGDGYLVLPELRALGRGVHGVVGEATVLLRLVGDAVGEVGVAAEANATLAAFKGCAVGVHGLTGEAKGNLPVLLVSSVGSVGAGGDGRALMPMLKGAAIGHHDTDDEDAIIALLLAA